MSLAREDAETIAEGPAHQVARESYARCIADSGFFPSLYDFLLASDPTIPPMFAETEFPRQYRLLQHGLGLLLSYAREPDPRLLDRIAARHGRRGLGVKPAMYRHFETSLLEAVRRHDPECTDGVEEAWREAIRPGLDFMGGRYES